MPNLLYNNSIAIKLLVGKVGEFWWETRLWLKLIVGHCRHGPDFCQGEKAIKGGGQGDHVLPQWRSVASGNDSISRREELP
jgi:hypothetical protein